jgi:hypothetical protein
MREIEVFVGVGLNSKGIMDALNRPDDDEAGLSSTTLFEVAHALLEQQLDDRAQIDEVTVEEVTINPDHPNVVTLELEIRWSAYYGCRDMNAADVENEVEAATYTSDGHLIFTVPDRRRPANYC